MQAEYLKFSVENQQTLLPLTQIQIILRLPKLQVVPNKTKGFEGILNYHGTSVPVYNLGDYIGTVGVPCEVDTPLILCQIDSDLIGILVSEVNEVVFLDAAEIQNPKLSNLPPFVKGVYAFEDESMWLITLEALIDMKSASKQVADNA